MLSLFASYCRNQQFMRQVLRKPFTPFCLSNQNIQQHINTIIELREKYQANQDQTQTEQLASEINQYENDLDSYLTKFMVHQRQPYYLFRKHLIELAYKSCFLMKNMSIKYIESASCGDYENHYTDELKQVFLAQLYGIKFRINYYFNVEEQLAVKSLAHWQNVINTNCSFYKQWKENGSFDIDEFTKNKEIVYYEQYLECLVAAIRVFYRHGDFEKSKTYFEEAQTKIQEAIQIVFYFKTQLYEMKGKQKDNYQQFIENYKNQFFKFLVNSYIIQIKISLWERNFELGDKLLDEVFQKQIANEQQKIQLFMIYFELLKSSEINSLVDNLNGIGQFIIQVYEKTNYKYLFYSWDMVQFLDESYAFLLKYHPNTKNNEEKAKFFYELLEVISESYIEVCRQQIEISIINNGYEIAYNWCCKAINYLIQRSYTKHYFLDSLIFSILLSVYNGDGCKTLQKNLQEIDNDVVPIIERPIQNIVEFFELIVELEQISDFNEINQDLLQKIKKIEFEKYFMKYQKELVLEKIYQKYNLKQELEECYDNQIELISQHKQCYENILTEIEEKKKQNRI